MAGCELAVARLELPGCSSEVDELAGALRLLGGVARLELPGCSAGAVGLLRDCQYNLIFAWAASFAISIAAFRASVTQFKSLP